MSRTSDEIFYQLGKFDYELDLLTEDEKYFILASFRDEIGDPGMKTFVDMLADETTRLSYLNYDRFSENRTALDISIERIRALLRDYYETLEWRRAREAEEISRGQPRLKVGYAGQEIFFGRNLIEVDDDLFFIPTGFNCLIQCHEKAYSMIDKKSKIRDYCLNNEWLHDGVISLRSYNQACYDLKETRLYAYTEKDGKLVPSRKQNIKTWCSICFIKCFNKNVYHACLFKKGNKTPKLEDLVSRVKYSSTFMVPEKQIKVKSYFRKKNTYDAVCFFDIESPLVDGKFVPIMIGCLIVKKDFELVEKNVEYRCFTNKNSAVDEFITYLAGLSCRKILAISHNGGRFDNLMVSVSNKLKIIGEIRTPQGLIKLETKAGKKTIVFIDSYKIYPDTLKNFTRDISIGIVKQDYDIGNCLDINVFMERRKEIREYLKYDVFSLADAFLNLRKIFLKEFCLDIFCYCTIASIALDINKKISSFNDLYYTNDLPSISFIKQASYGGRVVVFNQKTQDSSAERLVAVDYNSLYPCAMMQQFPIGRYRVLNYDERESLRLELNNLSYKKFCIAKCVVQVPNNCWFPLLQKREKNRVIYKCGKFKGIYTNVDLEESIKWNDSKVLKIEEAIEWETSRKIFKNFIEHVYNLRKNAKEKGSSIQAVFKVILNSSYGKFLQVSNTTTEIVQKDKLTKFFESKYARTANKINDNYFSVKVINKVSKFTNLPCYIGAFVLSYSKRLMNEVFSYLTPKDLYYSDTDSVYISKEAYDNLPKSLIGPNLFQMKNDYGEGKFIKEAIFLAQKRYLIKFNDDTYSAKFLGFNIVQAINRTIIASDSLELAGRKCLCASGKDKKNCEFNACETKWWILRELYLALLDGKTFKIEGIEKWMRSINAVYLNQNDEAVISTQVEPYRVSNFDHFTFPINYDQSKFDKYEKVLEQQNFIKEEKNEIFHTHYYSKKNNEIVYNKPYLSKNGICLRCKEAKSNFITVNQDDEELICVKKDDCHIYSTDKFGCQFEEIKLSPTTYYLYLHLLADLNTIQCIDKEPKNLMNAIRRSTV